ncbi:SPOR domain-containing protein [Mycetocola reblochoni]|uniref:SPOR domain-containing protein n=1 Tax=Mycetocola reblochoni TaxID=331618 RepID=UPI003F95BC99
MTADGEYSYWYNLTSGEVEYGLVSPAVDRAGPFATREEAARAPETLAVNSGGGGVVDAMESGEDLSRDSTPPHAYTACGGANLGGRSVGK